MRKRRKIKLNIFTVLHFTMNFDMQNFIGRLTSPFELYIHQYGLLPSMVMDYRCIQCKGRMTFHGTPMYESKDSKFYRCTTKACRSTVGFKEGSFFEKSHLSPTTILLLVYYWVCQIPISTASALLGNTVTPATIRQWYVYAQEVAMTYMDGTYV